MTNKITIRGSLHAYVMPAQFNAMKRVARDGIRRSVPSTSSSRRISIQVREGWWSGGGRAGRRTTRTMMEATQVGTLIQKL